MSIKNLAKISLGCIAILFGFALSVVYAAPGNQADTNTYDTINGGTHLSYMPRVYLDGAGGYSSGSLYLGEAKILQPILMRYDRDLFLYGQGRFSNAQPSGTWSNSPWSGSLGIGYRQIMGQSVVLGGYVLGGYSKTPTDHSILFVNPGFEALGKVWEFRLNGYFPVSKSKWVTQGWADNFGNNDYVMYTGHDEYDAWFTYNETAGMGADTQIGRKLFKFKNTLVKGFLEGYYFSEGSNNAVTGGGATITVQPTSYLKFSLTDTYDNYAHNTAMLGIEVSLYDLFSGNSKTTDDLDLTHRLYEPIQNNFAAVGSGNVIPTAGGPGRGKPDIKRYYPPSESLTPGTGNQPYISIDPQWHDHSGAERTNIWFFNGNNPGLTGGELGAVGNGTYEHPYSGSQFTQAELDAINRDTILNNEFTQAYLYFTAGTYNAYTNQGGSYSPFEVHSYESIWGRTGDHKGFGEAATGNNRPVFSGSLTLDGNNSLNDMVLQNNSHFDIGVVMTGNVNINDVQIGADDSYKTGIKINNASNLTLNKSSVYGYNAASSGNENGVGIEVDNGSQTTITATNGSWIEGHSIYGNGIGLYVAKDANGNAEVGNLIGDAKRTSKFLGQSDNASNSGSAGYGVYAASTAITRIGSIDGLNIEGVNSGVGSAYGLYAVSNASTGNSQTSIGSINNSEFYAAADLLNKLTIKNAIGFEAASTAGTTGNATTTIGSISNSRFYGYSNLDAYGLFAMSSSQNNQASSVTSIGDISNSILYAKSLMSKAYGLKANSMAMQGAVSQTSLGNLTNSQFTANGMIEGEGLALTSIAPNGKSSVSVGNIESSIFTGQDYGLTAKGFDADAIGNGGSGNSNVTIGNINGSKFLGESDFASTKNNIKVYGFYVNTAAKGTVIIGNVQNDTFQANAKSDQFQNKDNPGAPYAYSFYINAGSGTSKLDPKDGSITIGTMNTDTFITKNLDASLGYTLYQSTGVEIDGSGTATQIDGYQVLGGDSIYAHIKKGSIFNLAPSGYNRQGSWNNTTHKACKKDSCI